jgi:hypothetical protein
MEPEILLLDAHDLLQNLKKVSTANNLLVTRIAVHIGLKIGYDFITEEICNHNLSRLTSI